MNSPLDALIDQAARDPALELKFLRALLGAELFVHLPLSDDSGKTHLIQFTRADGLPVIPVFTTWEKASLAAQGAVRVGNCMGRDLLEATRGATLMLNPNDISTTLYPEEIAALLDHGTVTVAPARGTPGALNVAPAGDADRWIGKQVAAAVRDLPGMSAVHLLHGWLDGHEGPPTHLLIGVCVPDAAAEWVARVVGLTLSSMFRRDGRTVDLATYSPDEELPSWLQLDGLVPVWTATPKN